MGVPISQMWTVASHILRQRIRGRTKYPLVLMLEPLFRCNLACVGCGKIQLPADILKRQLTPEQCFKAVEECGAPVVSIPGGEPLLHPQIADIVQGLVRRKKYVYLCTNALLLERKMHLLQPSKYLTINVHLDGPRELHDHSVNHAGGYDLAVKAIKEAIRLGFRVTTNTTLFDNCDPDKMRGFFDEMMDLGIEGMTISPGYAYASAPDQGHFLDKRATQKLFAGILGGRKRRWRFNHSPLFLQFLMGLRDYDCTPWGMPAYNLFGWQKPCYLLQEGSAGTFAEFINETEWSKYGARSGNPKCSNCMVHSGYEASAVHDTFYSLRGLWDTLCASVFPGRQFGR